jgi:hypothetical protein
VILLFAVASVSAAEYQVHEGEPIQAVINIANPGYTIIVHNGTYTENVAVNKSDILIYTANGSAVTIVQSNRTDMHVFEITNQINVTLKGFCIRNASAALNTTVNDIVKDQAISALTLPVDEDGGYICITSTPPGADILIDGWPIGAMTPHTLPAVPGTYTIKLTLAGYQGWTKSIDCFPL